MYTARVVGKIDDGWGKRKIGVFDGDNQIGEYERNYSSFCETTFLPFELRGKWYALYSPNYTCTRIMSLPDCKDIGGEEPSANGFCPVDYYVPELCGREFSSDNARPIAANHQSDVWAHKVYIDVSGRKHTRFYWPDDKDHPEPNEERRLAYLEAKEKSHKEYKEWSERHPFVVRYAPFGFVAGCVWGDDSSMKLQFLDLSRADEGILVRDDRFGYIEVQTPIKDNVEVFDPDNLADYDVSKLNVRIYQSSYYTMGGTKRDWR